MSNAAHITAAEALEAAAKALRELAAEPAPSTGLAVGTTIPRSSNTAIEQLDAMPVGTKVTDRDDDTWTKGEDGWVLGRSSGPCGSHMVSAHTPLTVTKVGELAPEPVPAPAIPKVGDTVRVTKPIDSARPDLIGHVGKLTKIETGMPSHLSQTGTRYSVDPYWYAGGVEVVEAGPEPTPDPEPAPTTVETYGPYNDRLVKVEPRSLCGIGSGARLRVARRDDSEGQFSFLTVEECRQVAATLLAIADA